MGSMRKLADYAPLSGSFVQLLAKYLERQPPCEKGIPFHMVRAQVVGEIRGIVSKGRLDTTHLCRVLTRVSPEGIEVTRDQIWLWKQKGALRYIEDEYPNVHSAMANAIARRLHRGQRGWNPRMSPEEPLFYCKVEAAPGEPVRMVAYPFEQNAAYLVAEASSLEEGAIFVPPRPKETPDYSPQARLPGWYRLPDSALVYSPYAGVVLCADGTDDPRWLGVEGGAIRFWGEIKMKDLSRWDPHVARMELEEEQIPDIVAAAKTLALQLLAYQRLPHEQQAVPWKACAVGRSSGSAETVCSRSTGSSH